MRKKSKIIEQQQKYAFLKRRCVHQVKKIDEVSGVLSFIEKHLKQSSDQKLSGVVMLINLIQAQLENRCQLMLVLLDEYSAKNNTIE